MYLSVFVWLKCPVLASSVGGTHAVVSTLYFWWKKRRDVENVILTSYQRCVTNVVSTSINKRCINVVLDTLNQRRSINVGSRLNQRCFDVVNVLSLYCQVCIFNYCSTSNERPELSMEMLFQR